MINIERSIVIGKPVDIVFAVVSDGSQAHTWQNGLEAVEGQTNAVGSQFTEVRRFMGQEMRSVMEVTAFDPNSRWAARVVKGPVPYEITVMLEPQDGGTRLTTRIVGEPTGFFKVAEGMFTGQLEKSIDADTNRLKGILEAG